MLNYVEEGTRKCVVGWCMISFKPLGIDKGEWLEDSSASFLVCVEEFSSEKKVGGLKRDLIQKLN